MTEISTGEESTKNIPSRLFEFIRQKTENVWHLDSVELSQTRDIYYHFSRLNKKGEKVTMIKSVFDGSLGVEEGDTVAIGPLGLRRLSGQRE